MQKFLDKDGVSRFWQNIKTFLTGYVPSSRKVNGKSLTSDITLSASDVSAVPTTRTVNGKALSSNITISSSDIDLSDYAPKASPIFTGSISLGRKSGTTVGDRSSAIGYDIEASGEYSHAEGRYCISSGDWSHAEGSGSVASGRESHAENWSNAIGVESHAEGSGTYARGEASHAEGYSTVSIGIASHSEGYYTSANADYQHVCGKQNVRSTLETDKVIVGKGVTNAYANCFRVTDTGIYSSGANNTSGADYAEMFEWADGNPDNEDRCGLFVTFGSGSSGGNIRIATPADDYIIGIVSGNPSVVGDVHDDQWKGIYLYDVFGRPLWEDVEVPDEIGPDGEVIIPAHTEHRQELNPNYDGTQKYQARSERPEWDAVGMLGKLVAVDDGTCEAGGWAKVGRGGKATASADRTRFRVMERIDNTHVRILIL